jgi:hypothetical protein
MKNYHPDSVALTKSRAISLSGKIPTTINSLSGRIRHQSNVVTDSFRALFLGE